MSFAKLDELGRKLEALEHALAMLGADEATHMAVGGGEKRAEAMSALAGMHHRQATAPEIADWIAAAEQEALNEEQVGGAARVPPAIHQPDLPVVRVRRAADRGAHALRAAVARAARQERLGRLPAGVRGHRRAGARGSRHCAPTRSGSTPTTR